MRPSYPFISALLTSILLTSGLFLRALGFNADIRTCVSEADYTIKGVFEHSDGQPVGATASVHLVADRGRNGLPQSFGSSHLFLGDDDLVVHSDRLAASLIAETVLGAYYGEAIEFPDAVLGSRFFLVVLGGDGQGGVSSAAVVDLGDAVVPEFGNVDWLITTKHVLRPLDVNTGGDSGSGPNGETFRLGVFLGTNNFPVFTALTNATVPELILYEQELAVGDPDVSFQPLEVRLVHGPNGSIVTNGVFRWVPSEVQGPSTNQVIVSVSDGLVSTTNTLWIIVTEVNVAPVPAIVADQVIDEKTTLSLMLSASDSDLPANRVTFVLESGPAGMTISPVGALQWTSGEVRSVTTNDVVFTVTDDGLPSLSATNRLLVIVRPVAPEILPRLTIRLTTSSEALVVDAFGPALAELVVEVSADLDSWTEVQRIVGRGDDVSVPLQAALGPSGGNRFWRLRRP
jgi:hypothetical protein